jgi:hypothetical protein
MNSWNEFDLRAIAESHDLYISPFDTSGPSWLPLADAMSSDPPSVSACTLPTTCYTRRGTSTMLSRSSSVN